MKKLLCIMLLLTIAFVAPAQNGNKKSLNKIETQDSVAVKYTCEMHPEIVSNIPGKCPKCGMELTKLKTYTCEMHPEIVSHKPGKCPKCDMELTEVQASKKK